ncbi:MAG: hypothetical protein WAM70_09080 [Pyrinomonadaceae bacterium]
MKIRNSASAVLLVLTLFGIVAAQDAGKITAARVARAEGEMTGAVYVTIDGRETKIADAGVDAWVIQRGRQAVYSGRDGSGGYENEGMSLYVYDARTGRQRKIMSEYFMVEKVAEVTTRSGRTALLVELEDGGLGASYFAVVDPARGEVFFRRWARQLSRKGDNLVLGFYKEDDWEKLGEPNARVRPHRRESHNLSTILKRRVIVNKREPS